jgi:hypothetical protein
VRSHCILILSSNKGRAKARDDDAGSVDSMAMEVDGPGSDFGSDAGHPSPGKKTATSRGKRAAPSMVPKKASGSGRRKGAVSRPSLSPYMYDLHRWRPRVTTMVMRMKKWTTTKYQKQDERTARPRQGSHSIFIPSHQSLSYVIAIRKRARGPLPTNPHRHRPRLGRQRCNLHPLALLLGGHQPGQQLGEREGRWPPS